MNVYLLLGVACDLYLRTIPFVMYWERRRIDYSLKDAGDAPVWAIEFKFTKAIFQLNFIRRALSEPSFYGRVWGGALRFQIDHIQRQRKVTGMLIGLYPERALNKNKFSGQSLCGRLSPFRLFRNSQVFLQYWFYDLVKVEEMNNLFISWRLYSNKLSLDKTTFNHLNIVLSIFVHKNPPSRLHDL